ESTAFSGLERLPHLACPVAYGPMDSLISLRWAMRVLAQRAHGNGDEELTFDEDDGAIEDGPLFEHGQGGEPALVILVDGAGALCSNGNRRVAAEVEEALRRLLSSGSEHSIHMALSTEQPEDVTGINTSWGARIAGRVE